jgi:hypothetical protein
MDTAEDTGAPYEDCGIVAGMRLWVYHGISLDKCYIPVGAIFSVPYNQKEELMNPSEVSAPPTVPATSAVVSAPPPASSTSAAETTELVSPAPLVAPVAHTEVPPAQPSPEDLVKLASSETGANGLLLALLAVAGSAGALKLYSDWSKQKHELKMKQAEIEADLRRDEKGLNGAQPPPCQTAQAKVEADLASLRGQLEGMDARIKKSEKLAASFPGDFNPEDIEELKKQVAAFDKHLKATKRSAGVK